MKAVSVLAAMTVLGGVLGGAEAAHGIGPAQVVIEAKFVEVTQDDLNGFGVELALQNRASYLNDLDSVGGWGDWYHFAGVGYDALGGSSLLTGEAGVRCARATPVLGRPVEIEAGLSLFVGQRASYDVRTEIDVVDEYDPYTDEPLVTHREVQNRRVDAKTLYGVTPTLGARIPLLKDVPLLGRLFAGVRVPVNSSELIVFVGASIVVPFGDE